MRPARSNDKHMHRKQLDCREVGTRKRGAQLHDGPKERDFQGHEDCCDACLELRLLDIQKEMLAL